jgi:Spy/CpxP family protein refolding chaperone
MGGKHGGKMHGKHGGPDGVAKGGDEAKRDPAEHLAKKVDALCEPITCTAEQKTQLTSTFEGVHQAHRDARAEHQANKPDFKPLADLFRAETFDQAKVRAVLAEGKTHMQDRKAEHGQEFGSVLAEIHDILTPEQRGILADKIAADGLHSIMGGHGKQGHGEGHKRGHGKRGGDRDVD